MKIPLTYVGGIFLFDKKFDKKFNKIGEVGAYVPISQIKTICEIKLPPASYLWEGYRK